MDQLLSIITLGVGDLARSKAFYERLGWKPRKSKGENIVFFQLPGVVLALYPRDALADDANQADTNAPTHAAFKGFTLAQTLRSKADVDKKLAEAVAAGATLIKPAHDAFWGGYSGYFADPDGFAWEIAFNPYWPLEADGTLVRLD